MSECIAIVSDLIFASRITGTAAKLGVKCAIVKDEAALQNALESMQAETALVDLHCDGICPEEAIRAIKAHTSTIRVVAFASHVEADLMEQAKAAGADDVLPRSSFVQQLPQLLSEADDSTS